MIHRSGCPVDELCRCDEGRKPAAGHVVVYSGADSTKRYVNAHYRPPRPGEWATDVDGQRFKVAANA